jgi:hypothetical protein
MKNAHLLRFPYPSSLRRTDKYASLLRIAGALHLGIFDQPFHLAYFIILLKSVIERQEPSICAFRLRRKGK